MKSFPAIAAMLLSGTAIAQSTTAGTSPAKDAMPSTPAQNRTPFDSLERDRNGKLSPTEASSVITTAFTTADKNDDGSLDRSEYAEYLRKATTPSDKTPGSNPPNTPPATTPVPGSSVPGTAAAEHHTGDTNCASTLTQQRPFMRRT